MLPRQLFTLIERELLSKPSAARLWNFYLDEHPEADVRGGASIRLANLRSYIGSYKSMPEVLILGEAPGPWGCRFSGVPFTSERQLCAGDLPFRGSQSSSEPVPHAERTASIFWNVVLPYYPRFFIWNAVPLFPHVTEAPFALRRPSSA
jgi:hypothetical protein